LPFALAQNQDGEFASLSGSFAIKLPLNYDDFKYFVPLKIGDNNYNISLYKWSTAAGLFTVSYTSGSKNLEQPDHAKDFFADFRKLIVSRLGDNGRLLGEKNVSLGT